MKTNSSRLALMLLGIVSLAACGGYSSGPAGNGDGAGLISGTFTGIVNGTSGDGPFTLAVTFTIVQTGNSFSGTFTTADTGGNASGTVSGTTATFTISQTTPCAGTFTGSGTTSNSGGSISGSYNGTSPCTGPITATFVVNRVAGTGPPGY